MTLKRIPSTAKPFLCLAFLFHGAAILADFSAPPRFIRGDANLDGRVDISDPILTLGALFLGTDPLACLDAADSNDSGRVDLSDPIHTMGFLFLGHPAPGWPFPNAGLDASPDDLDCLPSSLEPGAARPVSAADVDDGANPPALRGVVGRSGAIEVSPALFDLLMGLPAGASLLDHVDEPDVRQFMDELGGSVRPARFPVASPGSLSAPAGPAGCYRIDATKLRGRSHDTGPDATPDPELAFRVSPEEVCGPGQHVVELTVTDADGNSSTAPTIVALCSSSDDGCVEQIHDVSPPFDGPEIHDVGDDVSCRWIVTEKLAPGAFEETLSGTYFDPSGARTGDRHERPVPLGDGGLELYFQAVGPGPDHALFATRAGAPCTMPRTDLKLSAWGTAVLRMNVLCFRGSDCVLVGDPQCASRVDVEGTYQGATAILSDSGPACVAAANPIEALAQEEAALLVNGGTLFSKAITLQNGNRIQKTISYQIAAGIGVSPIGLAGNFGASVGVSQSVTQNTGHTDGVLNAMAGAGFPTPVTAHLDAEGRAEIVGEGRATGYSRAHTKAYALYAWGVSNCPGAGYASAILCGGRGEAFEAALDEARDFFFQRTGSDSALEKLIGRPR